MGDLFVRFLVGGSVVTAFAMIADVLRPKSFAGLFGAAPSIALATLGLTIAHQGRPFAALEARSMVLGSLAFLAYAAAVSWVLRRWVKGTLWTTVCLMPIWFLVAFALYGLLRGTAA